MAETSAPAETKTLPAFSNVRAVCAVCGNRREIRLHFDRSCPHAQGDLYHRLCPCAHEWVERCGPAGSSERPTFSVLPGRALPSHTTSR